MRAERPPTEDREAIWLTKGRENVTSRITSLIAGAEEEALFATAEPGLLTGAVAEALVDAAELGIDVTVASAQPAVREAAREAGISVVAVEDAAPDLSVGRLLLVGGDTVLLSVQPATEIPSVGEESAFWSDGTGFARVLAALIRQVFV